MKNFFPKSMGAVLLFAGLFVSAGQADAQAMSTESGPGSYVAAGGTVSLYEVGYGQRELAGVSAYVDTNLTTRYGIESEARWLVLHQAADVHATTWLAGPRVSIDALAFHGFSPYVKVLAGVADFNYPYNYATGKYFVVSPGVGVDYRISQRMRIRLIDVEYQTWPQFSFGTMNSYGVSIGLSYRVF